MGFRMFISLRGHRTSRSHTGADVRRLLDDELEVDADLAVA
jgi:hypothetical protein